MQVIGFNLTKVSIEREEKPEGKLEIKQNIHIDDLAIEKVPISKDEAIRLKFVFSVDYNDGKFARLELKGNVILLPQKDELKKFKKAWQDKQVPEESKVPLFNFIMNKCNIKAIQLEDEMNLPIHVQLPKLQFKKEE